MAVEGEEPAYREVRFEYSGDFPRILEHLHAALLVSTYQAGKLAVVGVHQGRLAFAFHNFERVMGVAMGDRRVAVGTRRQVFFLHSAPELASGIDPRNAYDACWLARTSLVTGNIHGHELAWGSDGLWVVNTLFSALCTLDEAYSFVPRWRPPFIRELAAQDRCHLNGLAMQDGRPRYVTAHGETDEPAGWRPGKATGGCLIDVPSGQTVARHLAMPHSPRVHDGRLWVLDSGTGRLVQVDPASGRLETVETLPGFTRGLAFAGQFAFVGLSKIRETAVFGGLPIAERRDELRCGVAVVDLVSGRAVAALQFHSGVEEIFAVAVLPGRGNPVLSGPHADEDGRPDIWVVPPESKVPGVDPAAVAPVVPRLAAPAIPVPLTGFDPGPGSVPALAREAAALQQQGRQVEALERLKQATALAPDRADLPNDLGNLYQELGDQQAALACYRRAVQAQPDFAPAHQNLGYLLFNMGEPEAALEHFAHAQRSRPQAIDRVLAAGVLPVIYDSAEDLHRWRRRLVEEVHRLAEEGVRIDTTDAMVPTNFFVAYQGENDRELMRDWGRIYQGVGLCAPGGATPAAAGDRIRVGFLSAYFRDHTIGRLNLGRVRHLSRRDFEVTVLYAGRPRDETTAAFQQAADRFVPLPRRVEAARRLIADLGLDILLFADVGMDALTTTLAYSRMAPVQCVTWGHPETTGSPAMDYFLSGALLEAYDADAHYTERLVRLPNLGTYYERPKLSGPPRLRESFGLDPGRRVYLCPQTLFKFHPDFDPVLAGILAADPDGDLVLLEGRLPSWTERLRRRLARTLPEAARRVRFLPPQPYAAFLHLLAAADVVLDPLPFGGGNTSYEALAVGTPVVTWPGRFLRGRITQALYRKMGLTECIVGSAEEYVALATQIAINPEQGRRLRLAIESTSHVLFEDPAEVRALEEFFKDVHHNPSHPSQAGKV